MALDTAVPGDEIVLQPGTYQGRFEAWTDCTEGKPITVRSADPDNMAVLDAFSLYSGWAIAMYVAGNHWSLQNLIFQNANKGVIFENAQGGEIVNCEVRSTGESPLFSLKNVDFDVVLTIFQETKPSTFVMGALIF